MSSIPAKIRVFGRDYLVSLQPIEDGIAGLCFEADYRILVDNDQHPIDEADTLLHEALHALSYVSDLKLSERQVRGTATGLIGIFRDNPDLLPYIQEKIK